MATLRVVTALLILALTLTSYAWTQTSDSPPAHRSANGLQIYATPEHNSQVVGHLSPGENTTPIAETQSAGGHKWFLVKTKTGLIGWIKGDNGEHSNKVENFFKSLPPDPGTGIVTIPNVSSNSAPRGAMMIPVLSAGRSMIVSATMNQTISGNLIIDTGATNTVISRRLANLLTLQPIAKRFVHTVGGPVSVSLARLGSLKVGAAEANNLMVLVHDFSPDPRIEGLLGMDFLGRFQFGFDSQKQLLILSPR